MENIFIKILILTFLIVFADATENSMNSASSEQKSIKCEENEELNDCVFPLRCQKSCKKLDNPKKCKSTCELGCRCKIGYLRGKNNKCVEKSACKKCKQNEEFKCACGERRCPFIRIPRCSKCVHNCYCKAAFFRDVNNECVYQDECEKEEESSDESKLDDL